MFSLEKFGSGESFLVELSPKHCSGELLISLNLFESDPFSFRTFLDGEPSDLLLGEFEFLLSDPLISKILIISLPMVKTKSVVKNVVKMRSKGSECAAAQ